MKNDLITITRSSLEQINKVLKEIVDQDRLPPNAGVYKATVTREDVHNAITPVRNLLGLEPIRKRHI